MKKTKTLSPARMTSAKSRAAAAKPLVLKGVTKKGRKVAGRPAFRALTPLPEDARRLPKAEPPSAKTADVASSQKRKVIPIVSASQLESLAQCERRAWLEVHHPERAEAPEATGYWRMQAEAVRQAAKRQFSGAFTVEGGLEERLSMTQTLLRRHPGGSFFDPSFLVSSVHVQPDVLESKKRGVILSEITASTARGGELPLDKLLRMTRRLSLNVWAARSHKLKTLGLAVHALDRDEAWDGVDPTYQGLLRRIDLTEQAKSTAKQVPHVVRRLREVLAQPQEPSVRPTRHCKKPFPCPFMSHCKADPARPAHTIYDIPGRHWKLQDRWAAEGHYDLSRLPAEEFDQAPPELQRVMQSILTKTVWVSPEAGRLLEELPFPRYYFDFEAISLALPAWKGRRPYEQVPFQWSLHIETAPGVFTHKSFLDLSGNDPSHDCAKALVKSLGRHGPVLVYHAAYESNRLKEMAERHPELSRQLLAIEARLVDLEVWVRDCYYHPKMEGSYSIKKVLPCLAPEFSYDQLEGVQNGVDAQIAYLSAVRGGKDESRFNVTRTNLLRYCGYDTWAMVVLAYRLAGLPVPKEPALDKRPLGINTFRQARLVKSHRPHVWSLWESERPALATEVHWSSREEEASET